MENYKAKKIILIPGVIYWDFRAPFLHQSPSSDAVLGAAVFSSMSSHPLRVLRRVVDWSGSPHERRRRSHWVEHMWSKTWCGREKIKTCNSLDNLPNPWIFLRSKPPTYIHIKADIMLMAEHSPCLGISTYIPWFFPLSSKNFRPNCLLLIKHSKSYQTGANQHVGNQKETRLMPRSLLSSLISMLESRMERLSSNIWAHHQKNNSDPLFPTLFSLSWTVTWHYYSLN